MDTLYALHHAVVVLELSDTLRELESIRKYGAAAENMSGTQKSTSLPYAEIKIQAVMPCVSQSNNE